MSESAGPSRSRSGTDAQNVKQYYLRATNLPPTLRGWKTFKDLLRQSVSKQPGWVRTHPEHKSADCTIKGRRDADLAFEALSNTNLGSRIEVVMWDISNSASPVLVRQSHPRTTPNPFPAQSHLIANTQAYMPQYVLPSGHLATEVAPSILSQPVVGYPASGPTNSAPYTVQYIAPAVHQALYQISNPGAQAIPVTVSDQDTYSSSNVDMFGDTSSSTTTSEQTCVYLCNLSKDTSVPDLIKLLNRHNVTDYNYADIYFESIARLRFDNERRATRAFSVLHEANYKGKRLRAKVVRSSDAAEGSQDQPEPFSMVVNGST